MTQEEIDIACRDLSRRVAPMYQAVGWKWLGVLVTELMLYTKARELLEELLGSEPLTKTGKGTTAVSTGGLEARRYRNEEGTTSYEILFRVAETLRSCE